MILRFIALTAFLILFTFIGAAEPKKDKKAAAPALIDGVDSMSYAIGVDIGNNLKKNLQQEIIEIRVDALVQGIKAGFNSDTSVFTDKQVQDALAKLQKLIMDKRNEKSLGDVKKFFEENRKKPGVFETPSGLQYEILAQGNGKKPTASSSVKVHYHGTLPNGQVFDSSVERDTPAEFPLGGVIKGWTEGLQLMNEGSKFRFYIPPELGYGERGAGGKIGPNQILIFEVELIQILDK